jgi:hypothetical protein
LLAYFLLACLCWSTKAVAITTITNPSGGKIQYGQVTGQSSLAGAMGAVLSAVHTACADRPDVGKVFQVKNTQSTAVFFTVTNVPDNNTKVAGLLIVSQVSPQDVEAALVTDQAARFGTTVNPMLKTLFSVWHPGNGAAGAPSNAAASSAVVLHPFALQDNSASVSLPDGWNVSPQSGLGTIIATGPHGEAALLDFPFRAADSAEPQVQQDMQFAQGAGAETIYARTLYYPYNADPGDMYTNLLDMYRQKIGLPPISIQIASVEPMASEGDLACAHLTSTADVQDGAGPKRFNTIFCRGPLSPMGSYMCLVFETAVPVKYALQEQATMGAILASFNVNAEVVDQEAGAIAAPAIRQIQAIGAAAAAQADQAHAAEDNQEQSFDAQENSEDQQGEAFGNYLLGQTVISDAENGTHSTEWNDTADAMVQSDPDRYQYVNAPDYWKGVDY